MTDTTLAVEEIIKTDVLGRRRTSAARRAGLLEEFDRSGLSGAKFAELAGIKYQTFATWLQKRNRRRAAPAAPARTARWLEAVVAKAQGGGPSVPALVVELPGGARMEVGTIHQATLAAELVRSLAKTSTSSVESPC